MKPQPENLAGCRRVTGELRYDQCRETEGNSDGRRHIANLKVVCYSPFTKVQREVSSMQAVRAIFDGHEIKPLEPIKTKIKTEVLVIFPDVAEKLPSQEARRLLRGAGKGEHLTEKLLKSRAEDLEREGR